MSAIYGILNIDNNPVVMRRLDMMKQAMMYWGPNGSGIWTEGSIGLGHLVLYNTPESLNEIQPSKCDGDRLVITANVRLDNRDYLFRELGIPLDEQELMPDSSLLIKAYDRWGEACPHHLLGDWAFAVWDKKRQRLFLSRDHMGLASLYYYRNDRTFVFASSLKGILSLPDVPRRLNTLALAQLGPEGKRDTSTFYQEIFQLGPGQTMSVSREKTNIKYYWHPKDITHIRLPSDQDYVDMFLDIYTEAVRCRLRSCRPVGVMLSGGLDSGSIATLAARDLPKGQPLLAFSWRPKYDVTDTVASERMGDESPFVEELCAYVGNIDVTFSRAEGFDPLAGIEQTLEILGQPAYQDAASYWLLSLMNEARKRDTGTLLHGMWGNITVSWEGDRVKRSMGLLAERHWLTLMRKIKSSRKTNDSLWRAVVNLTKKRSGPKRTGTTYSRGMIRSEAAHPILAAHPMTDPDLAALHRQAHQPLRSIYNMFQSGSLGATSEMGAAFGLELRTPMTDKRVVEFCLGIPRDQYARDGQDRLLIRRAMSGLMPEHILWNRRRGMIGGDISKWFLNDQVKMKATIQKIEASPLAQHWLTVSRMNSIFNSIEQKPDPKALSDFVLLMRGMMIGNFLQHFENE